MPAKRPCGGPSRVPMVTLVVGIGLVIAFIVFMSTR